MRATMPGALLRSRDGNTFFSVPYVGAIRADSSGTKIKVTEWGEEDPTLKPMTWIQEAVGDAVLAFFLGKMPRAAAARKGATFESPPCRA
jgi:hypothetical protein